MLLPGFCAYISKIMPFEYFNYYNAIFYMKKYFTIPIRICWAFIKLADHTNHALTLLVTGVVAESWSIEKHSTATFVPSIFIF